MIMSVMETEDSDFAIIQIALSQRGFQVDKIKNGKGGFGQVVKTKSLENNELFAIKIITLDNRERVKYHERELQLLKMLKLSERNVIEYFRSWILHVGNVQHLCIQMELCLENLKAFISDNSIAGSGIVKLEGPPRLYQQVFPQILNGLDAMHSLGWVHRDIHPGNILIAYPVPSQISDIKVKIADFGLARHIGVEFYNATAFTVLPKLEKLSTCVGHELYRAPELSTEDYGLKVDLFSAGILLYLLSCNLLDEHNFEVEVEELLAGKRDREHLCHQDDDRLSNLIKRLLSREAKDRPSAAEALQYMTPQTVTADTAGRSTPKRFFVKKRGVEILYRCITDDDTLASIKAEIQRKSFIDIAPDKQLLHHYSTVNGKEQKLGITSDSDVGEMFESAERQERRVIIVVSEKENIRNSIHPEV